MRELFCWLAAVQVGAHLILTSLCGGPVLVHGLAVLAGHTGAVVVTAALLRGSDAALWTADAVRSAGSYVLELLTPVTVTPLTRLRVLVQPPLEGPIGSMWRGPAPIRRGPPAGVVAS
jgi:hypothetical protein